LLKRGKRGLRYPRRRQRRQSEKKEGRKGRKADTRREKGRVTGEILGKEKRKRVGEKIS